MLRTGEICPVTINKSEHIPLGEMPDMEGLKILTKQIPLCRRGYRQ